MNNTDSEYFRLLNFVLEEGKVKQNRTGCPTRGVFGAQARFDLKEGFPLLTTKKVFFKGIVHELLWFLSGSTNIKYLVDNDVHIWDEWVYKRYVDASNLYIQLKNINMTPVSQTEFINKIKSDSDFATRWGNLGEGTYGGMWRAFPYHTEAPGEWAGVESHVDQISKVIDSLKNDPDSRRHIVSAWHPYHVDHCQLPPCHCLFQFHTEELAHFERSQLYYHDKKYVEFHKRGGLLLPAMEDDFDRAGVPKRRLNCQLYIRSNDLFLGCPFNIASYSLLIHMIAQVVNMVPGELIYTIGDAHIYENHLNQVKEQLNRVPKELPKLCLNSNIDDIFKFTYEDIHIHGYDPHPAIKGEVAV